MKLKQTVSIGCIDYGNNNFFEVMRDPNGLIVLCSHEDKYLPENPDGTYDSDGMTVQEFIQSVSDRPDFTEIMDDLQELCD